MYNVSNPRACCPNHWLYLWEFHKDWFLGWTYSLCILTMLHILLVTHSSTFMRTLSCTQLAPPWTLCWPPHNIALTSSVPSLTFTYSLIQKKKPIRTLFNQNLTQPACPLNILTTNGSELEYVDTYIGIWLDCSLSFHTHITHLQSKVRTNSGFVLRQKHPSPTLPSTQSSQLAMWFYRLAPKPSSN